MKKTIALGAAGLLSVGALAGCGGAAGGGNSASGNSTGAGAMAELVSAQKGYMDATSYSSSVTLQTTPEDMEKIYTLFAGDTTSGAQQVMVKNLVRSLAGFTTKTQLKSPVPMKELSDPNDLSKLKSMELAVSMAIGGKSAELVYTGGEAFAKADVKGMAEATGLGSAAQVEALAADAPSWAKTLMSGAWVGVPRASVDKMWAQADGSKASASASSTTSTQDLQQLQDKMGKAFQDNSTATYGSKDDNGQQIEVVTKVKPLLKQVSNDMKSASVSAMGTTSTAAADIEKSLSGLKDDATLKTLVWVKDGQYRHAEVDLAQIKDMVDTSKADLSKINLEKLKALTFQAKLVADMSSDASISKPEGATMLTEAETAQIFGAGSAARSSAL